MTLTSSQSGFSQVVTPRRYLNHLALLLYAGADVVGNVL